MSKGRKTLDQWIFEAIADPDKEGKISALSLVHRTGAYGEQEVHTFKFGGTSSAEPKRLAEVFQGRAESYCQDMPGVQTFNLLAFYGGRKEAEARQPFTVNTQQENHTNGLYTEPPNAEGQTLQTMRHREQQHQQVYRKQEWLDQYTLRLLQFESDRNGKLAAENMQAYEIVKDMMMRQALDTHNREMQKLQFQRGSEERAKLIKMVPPLVNTISGQEIFPQSTEDTALVEGIASVLTDEHLAGIMQLGLPDVVMGALASRVMKAREKKEAEDKRQSEMAVYQGNPVDDVVGGGE